MLDVIRKRRSCRAFNSQKVEDEKINEIVEAGLLAPSGMNRQTSIIIVIKDKETRDKLADLNRRLHPGWGEGFDPFYGAPVILLVLAHKDGLSLHDGAATMENMLLEATNQGLASIWVHRSEEEIRCKEGQDLLSFTGLNLEEYIGVGHVCVGYTDIKNYSNKEIRPNRVFYK